MENKKPLYIVLIVVASIVLLCLIVLAGCISISPQNTYTEPTDSTNQTNSQVALDTTGENTTNPEDTTAVLPENTTAETTVATEATEATESTQGQSNTETKPQTGNSGSTEPTLPSIPNEYPYTLTYKEYLDMTEKEQIEFYKLFKNHDEFKKWRTVAKKEYDDNKIEIEIGEDGKIDLDQILNGNH